MPALFRSKVLMWCSILCKTYWEGYQHVCWFFQSFYFPIILTSHVIKVFSDFIFESCWSCFYISCRNYYTHSSWSCSHLKDGTRGEQTKAASSLLGGARGMKSYHCTKWIWWPEFKFGTRLFTFHIVLILLGKVSIQLFSL